jgi:hypothetical protein
MSHTTYVTTRFPTPEWIPAITEEIALSQNNYQGGAALLRDHQEYIAALLTRKWELQGIGGSMHTTR